MNAVGLYVSAARLVLQNDCRDYGSSLNASNPSPNEQSLLDLFRLLPHLRQSLSCAVCTRMLCDPFSLRDARCQHSVCRLCVRGRKQIRPSCAACRDCQDFKIYEENKQMRCLLLCYKSLCEHLLASPLFQLICKQRSPPLSLSSGINVPTMSTQEFIKEGAGYEDLLNAFALDMQRPKLATAAMLVGPPLLSNNASLVPISSATLPLQKVAAVPQQQQQVQQQQQQVQQQQQLQQQQLQQQQQQLQQQQQQLQQQQQQLQQQQQQQKQQQQQQQQQQKQQQQQQHQKQQQQLQQQKQQQQQQKQQQQQQQQQITHTFPLPMIIKQEHIAAPSPSTTPTTKTPTYSTATPTLTVKSLKNIVDLSSAVQLSATSMSSSTSTLPHTVTYLSHNPNSSAIVGSLVSSAPTASTVTTAPLTIASAKLQSISRQIAAQQQRNLIAVSSSGHDLKPASLTFKLATTSTPAAVTTTASASITTTTATVTSQPIRNPPPIKTVSNGSAMYSVLYTGIGNKITIKRKTDGDDDGGQKKNFTNVSATAVPTQTTTVFRQVSKTNAKRRGCRCGNATPTPGKLTCCGQRCPCYVDSKSCIGCKCRGCRNPHRPDGGKVRPVIPELACYEIQMADSENSALSPGELPIATSTSNKLITAGVTTPATTTTNTNSGVCQNLDLSLDKIVTTTTTNQLVKPPSSSQQTLMTTTSRLTLIPTTTSSSTTNIGGLTANVIPYRNIQQITTVQQPQQQQQQQHTHATITSLSPQQQQKQPQQQQLNQMQQQTQTNVLQLENLQRESLLIQSAEGKYQVVNVFTTTSTQHNQNSNSNLQRIHTLPQLQAVANAHQGNNATFLIQTSGSSGSGSTANVNTMQHLHHQMPEISTTLPQIIMQQQTNNNNNKNNTNTNNTQHNQHHAHQQQPQRTQQQQHFQQQLKAHNNVITVHPISSHQVKPAAVTIPPSTITLSPILVTSPNSTYTSNDMFSESSSEEYLNDVNVNSAAFQPVTTISVSTANRAHASPYTLNISNNNNNSSSSSASSNNNLHSTSNNSNTSSVGQQHFVELIESNDL